MRTSLTLVPDQRPSYGIGVLVTGLGIVLMLCGMVAIAKEAAPRAAGPVPAAAAADSYLLVPYGDARLVSG